MVDVSQNRYDATSIMKRTPAGVVGNRLVVPGLGSSLFVYFGAREMEREVRSWFRVAGCGLSVVLHVTLHNYNYMYFRDIHLELRIYEDVDMDVRYGLLQW